MDFEQLSNITARRSPLEQERSAPGLVLDDTNCAMSIEKVQISSLSLSLTVISRKAKFDDEAAAILMFHRRHEVVRNVGEIWTTVIFHSSCSMRISSGSA